MPDPIHYLHEDLPGDPGPLLDLYAWVSIDAMDGTGLCGMGVASIGGSLPLVAQRLEIARDVFGPIVREHLAPAIRARTYELRRYSLSETLESFYEPPEPL